MPDLRGTYFYGDYCEGKVFSFEVSGGSATNLQEWTSDLGPAGVLAFDLSSFGSDGQGEIYICDRDGQIRKILPLFSDLEVSGLGVLDAEWFLLHRDGNWSWEDLEFNTMHPVGYYRVYRGAPNGTFACIHSAADPEWTAGDFVEPAPGELLAYLVTAVSPPEESSAGTPPRNLTDPCAAP